MASLSADSIFSFVPRFILSDMVGSEVISSTRAIYDSNCCLASNRLLKASSLFLNFWASSCQCQQRQKPRAGWVNIPLIMLSISPDDSLPTELEMVMLALLPEVFSVAVTLRIPLTSTSKTTSRTASPAFMGGIGAKVNSPREVLSSQLTRSPWKTGN